MSNRDVVESLKWQKFPILNDGFVCLVDCMGDDSSIVQAARVSYGEGTRHVSDDRTLIRYLMRHRHSTPFEMAEVKLLVRVPMDCWRQWIRHRTANVNEYSTRYSEAIDSQQTTKPDEWRAQATDNKQGSGGFVTEWPGSPHRNTTDDGRELSIGEALTRNEAQLHELARTTYEERLRVGVAREQARKDLPLSTYTEAYWKCDLHNILNFLGLRMDAHAQQEIRQYATTIGEKIIKPLFPDVWSAFEDYRLNAMHLTALDVQVLRELSDRLLSGTFENLNDLWPYEWRGKEKCRERDECIAKLRRLGFIV